MNYDIVKDLWDRLVEQDPIALHCVMELREVLRDIEVTMEIMDRHWCTNIRIPDSWYDGVYRFDIDDNTDGMNIKGAFSVLLLVDGNYLYIMSTKGNARTAADIYLPNTQGEELYATKLDYLYQFKSSYAKDKVMRNLGFVTYDRFNKKDVLVEDKRIVLPDPDDEG